MAKLSTKETTKKTSKERGELYVVATPIGNLGDFSDRAKQVLIDATLIAAEDTRRTRKLLNACGIATKTVAYHAHNEARFMAGLLERLERGERVALVSDAGTPLISDPGFPLVLECTSRNIKVIPIPGPSAVTAALSVAGIPTQRFTFEGFLPARSKARKTSLAALKDEVRTMVFFEAPHRVLESLKDMSAVFGPQRVVTLCRELTKTFEQVCSAEILSLIEQIEAESIPEKGEFVLVVAGGSLEGGSDLDLDQLITELLKDLPPARVAAIAARLTGVSKSRVYDRVLALQDT